MEEKRADFISYVDDDNIQKNVWCLIVKKTASYVIFQYHNEKITLPWNRILKIKEKEVEK